MRTRSLLAATTAALALPFAQALPATAQEPPPAVRPDNAPTPIAGRENGKLGHADLVEARPGCLAARAAAPSLRLLFRHAAHDGVDLGFSGCYRPLAGQIATRRSWEARGQGGCAARVVTTPSGPRGTSQHGWGKAIDFASAGRGLTFSSPAFFWMQGNAHRYGWNHPGWARPGGRGCDEPWHWEWVGDGGSLGEPPVVRDAVGMIVWPAVDGGNETNEVVTAHTPAGLPPVNALIVGGAPAPARGRWLAGADGGVFAVDGAPFFGSAGDEPLRRPIVGIAARPQGDGYWLVAEDGGVFTFGGARFHGSLGAVRLNRPVVGMAPTPSGQGYWLVASDGGVFAFGDAAFHGSAGAIALDDPVAGIAANPEGTGYWLVAADGGVFAFGAAPFIGSDAGRGITAPFVGIAAMGRGYVTVAADHTTSGRVPCDPDEPCGSPGVAVEES